jgi:phosphatidylglycerol:prolipoprotein diacylglycerol transferase
MLPVLQIGPLALQTPGLLILVGIWFGLTASEKLASRFKIEPSQLYNLVLIVLLSGILGARLAYVIQYSSIFIANPLNIISPTLTMFNGEAGLVIGVIAGTIYAQRKSMQLWPTLDALVPGLSVFIIFYHLANFASGDAFGSATQMPFAVELWGQARYPVQLYEMITAAGIAAAIRSGIQRAFKSGIYQAGLFFWGFLALSALSRLFWEFFRGDSTTILGSIHVAQIIAWFILAVSLWRIGRYQPLNQDLPSALVKDEDHAA